MSFRWGVGDTAAVESTVAKAFELAGSLDVIVNNAGYGLLGTLLAGNDGEGSLHGGSVRWSFASQ